MARRRSPSCLLWFGCARLRTVPLAILLVGAGTRALARAARLAAGARLRAQEVRAVSMDDEFWRIVDANYSALEYIALYAWAREMARLSGVAPL